ncbi:Mycothiol acetyltransferase [Candidatus Gugararchaeum adminiculabundum]|nr:Mycothiol acetyltransferase [Candidatus Gugararchaeum adminiculabundum]
MKIEIRKAKLADVPLLVKMRNEFFAEHETKLLKREPRLRPHMERAETPKSTADYFAKCVRSARSHWLIAEVKGKFAGFLLVKLKKNPVPIYRIKEYGFFEMFYVKKEFRGAGVGSALKDAAVAWFRKKGMKYAALHSDPENREAREIYGKWGFFDYKVEMRTKL